MKRPQRMPETRMAARSPSQARHQQASERQTTTPHRPSTPLCARLPCCSCSSHAGRAWLVQDFKVVPVCCVQGVRTR